MTLDAIEVPMPGTIKIVTPDGTEHRVMRAEMTTEGLVIEVAPVEPVEGDVIEFPEADPWSRNA